MRSCVIDPRHGAVGRLFEKSGYEIARCAECGLITAECGFVPEQYESDDYYTVKFARQADIYSYWAFRWRWVARQIAALRPKASLLDVGAGNGSFVKIAREEFDLDTTGLEPSTVQVEFARRVLGENLLCRPIAECSGRFDVVTSFNVLEHVGDPLAMLRELESHAQPDGLLVMTTPSPDSIHARIKGLRRWDMICPPHHLNIFTKEALRQALRGIGFEIVRYDTLSTYIGVARRLEGDRNVLRNVLFQVLRGLGMGADHFIIARRPDAPA